VGIYPTDGEVSCISIQGDLLAYCVKKETPFSPMAVILNLGQEGEPACIKIKNKVTYQNDTVISVNLSLNYLILGNVFGALQVVDISQIKFPSPGERPVVELGMENKIGVRYMGTIRSHTYRGLVLAVKADSYRTFSGDETGKIIVHDYMKYQCIEASVLIKNINLCIERGSICIERGSK